MKTLGFATLLLSAVSATAADKATGPANEPAYNTATVVDIRETVTEVREVSKDQPMNGLHVMVQSGSETLDIYVAPAEFVKIFDVTFKKGDELHIIGSKVKFEGATVVLAREISMNTPGGTVTLSLRDKDGAPLWKYFLKPPVG